MAAVRTAATPTFDDVQLAAARIAGRVHHTPVATSRTLDDLVGAHVLLKCEQLQCTGAFKARGALNAVLALRDEEAARGVAAHSSGNHAAALAWAAAQRGIECHVVMPSDTPRVKVAAVEGYGATVTFCEPTLPAREAALARVLEERGAHEVHPYDDVDVIAGAGTACLELLQDCPGTGLVIAPVSGGGLLSGTSIAARRRGPACAVWGAEPAGADDARRSLAAGVRVHDERSTTIADGLRAQLSDRTFAILAEHVAGIVAVTDDEIVAAMRWLFERCKLVVEPSGAAGLAGLLSLAAASESLPAQVGVILSGGNVDVEHLPFATGHT